MDGSQEKRWRTPFVLGLGGAASRVLLHLRRHLPNARLLLFDTDLATLRSVERTDEGIGLEADELVYLPLRKPAEYRASADELLSWLSRRWLYNIPRSLQTEGLRPLGRLAFIDHRQTIADRLRAAIARCAEADKSLTAFVVSSIDGGTGSGMLLDMAYAVRQQFEEVGLPPENICGVLLHATLAKTAANDLRNANAYATLTELNHFMQGGATYRAGPMEVLPAGDVSEPPFRDAYLVDLGENLADAGLEMATDQVAEYLSLTALMAGGKVLESVQGSNNERKKTSPARLRSFGLSAIRFDRARIARSEAELLCLRLAQQWLGDALNPETPPVRIQPPDFQLDKLLDRLKGVADHALGGSADAHLRSLVIESSGKPPIVSDDDPAGPYGEELRRIHAVFGLPTQVEGAQPPRLTRFETAVRDAAHKLGEGIAKELTGSISELVDASQGRLPAAIAAGSLFHEHLRTLRQAAEAAYQQQQADATALWSRLQRGDLPRERSGWFGRSAATDDVETFLLRYCQLRLSASLHKQLAAMLQEVVRNLAGLNDQLFRLRQSIEWLAAEFSALVESSQAEPDATSLYGPALGDELQRFREPEFVTQFERYFSNELLASESGLLCLASRSPEDWRELKSRLLALGERLVSTSLEKLNAWQLLSSAHRSDGALAGVLAEAAENAAPKLRPAGQDNRLIVVIPKSGTEDLAELLSQTLNPSAIVRADSGDLIFCRETAGISLAETAASIVGEREQCAEAARRVLTRADVQWSPLETAAVS